MLKYIVPLLLIFLTNPASAQDCPDFFRFVDFGLKDQSGVIHRGGHILRAEGFDGDPLLLTERTKCRTVSAISKDGRGNPIPVVTSINYNPEKTGIALSELRVSVVDDAKATADENASIHLTSAAQADTELTRRPNSLCAKPSEPNTLSCQVVSPYAGNTALVIYCDNQQCTMPALAISEQISVSAVWASNDAFLSNPETAGVDIFSKVQQIHGFLKPLSSTL